MTKRRRKKAVTPRFGVDPREYKIVGVDPALHGTLIGAFAFDEAKAKWDKKQRALKRVKKK